jgi:hypothetical protein
MREAQASAAQAADERRRRWEAEYQDAIETWYARELQDSVRLCDQLEAEFHQTLSDAHARAAQHGQQLRDQWDPGN